MNNKTAFFQGADHNIPHHVLEEGARVLVFFQLPGKVEVFVALAETLKGTVLEVQGQVS